MKSDCLFCKLSHDPDTVIWENDSFAAIKDIHPKARLHLLVMPKEHIDNLDAISPEAAGRLVAAIQEVAKDQQVSGRYKVRFSVGRQAGQEIDHLHAHLLAD
ncbi:MAG TPA: HIT domain-containing protein [Candidatus Saccharimonadales bacterium]|nr:HIT domain-containing protein [Candidatus Saccharimonadales bacterium]